MPLCSSQSLAVDAGHGSVVRVAAAFVAGIGHVSLRVQVSNQIQGGRTAISASRDRRGSEPATDAPLPVMGDLELACPLSAVPADDLAGAERRMGAVHVAAKLTLVPVLVGSLGELALDPSAEGFSHVVSPSLGAVRLGVVPRSGSAVDAESAGGRVRVRGQGGIPKRK